MENQYSKTNIISSLFWKFMERGGTQGIQFLVQIFLARILTPTEYGTIAILNVFILLANVFVQSGLNTALIQKKGSDDLDFSSVFYISLVVAIVLYIALFFSSPFIANYYNNAELSMVLRVLAIVLFFGAINSIQNAYVAKKMMFKMLFKSSVWAITISGIVGITLAYSGFGVWALVGQQISNHLVVTLIMWNTIKWRPKPIFSITRVSQLFSFGWKLLASSLLNTLYMELRTLIIGKKYSSAMLGFFNRGQQFPQIIVNNINGSIQSVILPALASNQNDLFKVKKMMRRAIMTSSYIIFPLMVGLAVIAEPLIGIVLGEKWLPAVPYLQIYCAVYAIKPIYNANLQVINALGRSDIFLYLETITTVIGIVILLMSIPFGVFAIACGALLSGVISLVVYIKPNSKLISYGWSEQLKDILPSFFISAIMGMIVFSFNYLPIIDLYKIVLQVLIGGGSYLLLSILFKLDSFKYLLDTFKGLKYQKNR